MCLSVVLGCVFLLITTVCFLVATTLFCFVQEHNYFGVIFQLAFIFSMLVLHGSLLDVDQSLLKKSVWTSIDYVTVINSVKVS